VECSRKTLCTIDEKLGTLNIVFLTKFVKKPSY